MQDLFGERKRQSERGTAQLNVGLSVVAEHLHDIATPFKSGLAIFFRNGRALFLLWVFCHAPGVYSRSDRGRQNPPHPGSCVKDGRLKQPFRPADINNVINIDFADVFLPKHRVGNPGKNTELFVQIDRGLCRLKMVLYSPA